MTSGALTDGTKAVYSTANLAYARFGQFIRSGSSPIPRAEKFLLFIVYLAQVCNLAYSTIKVYAAGVRSQIMRTGHADPTLRNGQKCYQYKLLMRGIQRDTAARVVRTRAPLTKDRLRKVLKAIPKLNITVLDRLRLKAAVLLAFWGLFRSASFCGVSSVLKRQDIIFKTPRAGKRYLVAYLRKSKTVQFHPVRVYIYANVSALLCPFKAVAKFYAATKTLASPRSSVFALPGNPLTLARFNSLLKAAIRKAGLNPNLYSSHSLRAGAATTAANSGVPPYMIKKLGRWASDAYTIYIKDPQRGVLSAQNMM